MILEFVPKLGGQPVRVDVAQLVVRNDDGTPVCVAGQYGPQGTVRVAHAADRDFNQSLRAFGYAKNGPVTIETISVDPRVPSGARLVGGPGVRG